MSEPNLGASGFPPVRSVTSRAMAFSNSARSGAPVGHGVLGLLALEGAPLTRSGALQSHHPAAVHPAHAQGGAGARKVAVVVVEIDRSELAPRRRTGLAAKQWRSQSRFQRPPIDDELKFSLRAGALIPIAGAIRARSARHEHAPRDKSHPLLSRVIIIGEGTCLPLDANQSAAVRAIRPPALVHKRTLDDDRRPRCNFLAPFG